jgi:membrane-associated protease RseP (regulator of RpoE activity)
MRSAAEYPNANQRLPPLPRPPGSVLVRHVVFFLITFSTATIAGVIPPFGPGIEFPPAELSIWSDQLHLFSWTPTLYALFIVDVVYHLLTVPDFLIYGLSFSLPLMFVLFAHEMGHYIACRIYRVDCTLPLFIPSLPFVGPAGTFGAFIRIRSPMPTKNAIFDIGVAGPIAGFIALVPFAFIGIATMQTMPPTTVFPEGTLIFTDPVLLRGIGFLYGKDPTFGYGNPFYYAAWMGLLVTALNLIPSGQLDGGHAMYAVLGEKIHYLTGRVAFLVMATLSVIGMLYFRSPAGLLFAILLGVMMTIPHPEPLYDTPLDNKRKLIAVLTLIIFVLCFVPFPLQIT